MEAELGGEKWQFIDGFQRDWDALPPPKPPLTVGLDGGFIHAKVSSILLARESGSIPSRLLRSRCYTFFSILRNQNTITFFHWS
jgi:hypothetical protein